MANNATREVVNSISDAETSIMQVLWQESPLTAADIVERTKWGGSSHPKTIKTLLNRLLKKKAIDFKEHSRKYHYFPLIDQDIFNLLKADSLIDRLFDGKLSPLVSLFSSQTELSREDVIELKKIISRMEKGDG